MLHCAVRCLPLASYILAAKLFLIGVVWAVVGTRGDNLVPAVTLPMAVRPFEGGSSGGTTVYRPPVIPSLLHLLTVPDSIPSP